MGLRDLLRGWFQGAGSPDFSDHPRLQFLQDDFDLHAVTQTMENVVQHVASVASRCAVTVEGDLGDAWRPIVRPGRFMAILMRDLIECGNYVAEIQMPPGLRRASYFDIYGKSIHRYRLTFAEPHGQTVKKVPPDSVCHVKINNTHRDTPYEGTSPFSRSSLHRIIEDRYRKQGLLQSKRYLTSPTPETNAQATDVDRDAQRTDLVNRANEPGTEIVFSKTSRDQDMKIQSVDLTFSPTQPGLEMRRDLVDEIWDSISYPKILRAEAPPGEAFLDARAAWIDGWLQSQMSSVAEQLSKQLECDISIDTSPAKVPQVSKQAEVVKTLVEAGLNVADAMKIAGLET